MCSCTDTFFRKTTIPKEFKISQTMINWYTDYLKLKSFDEYYNQDRLFGFSLPPYYAIIKIFLEGMFVT